MLRHICGDFAQFACGCKQERARHATRLSLMHRCTLFTDARANTPAREIMAHAVAGPFSGLAQMPPGGIVDTQWTLADSLATASPTGP